MSDYISLKGQIEVDKKWQPYIEAVLFYKASGPEYSNYDWADKIIPILDIQKSMTISPLEYYCHIFGVETKEEDDIIIFKIRNAYWSDFMKEIFEILGRYSLGDKRYKAHSDYLGDFILDIGYIE